MNTPIHITHDFVVALRLALTALNSVPRFKVPGLDIDSYQIAAQCQAVLKSTEPNEPVTHPTSPADKLGPGVMTG